MRIGIISAIQEANSLLYQQLAAPHHICYANRLYTEASWLGHEIVSVFSRWGKVAAAITATHLITAFKVDAIIFTRHDIYRMLVIELWWTQEEYEKWLAEMLVNVFS